MKNDALLSGVLTEEETALLDTLPEITEPETKERPRWVVRRAADALAPQPEVDYILKGLITAGSVNIFYGEPGSKKTYALLSLAVCVASGLPWLDFGTDPRRVLIIDEESGERRMLRRLGEVLRGEGLGPETPVSFVSLAGFSLDDPNDAEILRALIESEGAGLVIIDALADTMTGDENSKQETQPVFNNLRRIAEATNCAVILIHHSNKAGGYRGSTAIKGSVDLMVRVESESGKNSITFTSEKSRDELPQTWGAVAAWIGDRFVLRPTEPEENVHFSKAENYVMRFLEENGPSAKSVIKAGADICSERAAESAIYSLTGKRLIYRTNPNERGIGVEATYALKGGNHA
ncbi:MAG: AAA family ATPase [Chloroflexi bacterium]|nr:AAA family ATPase [Chloroflexota bacterium]